MWIHAYNQSKNIAREIAKTFMQTSNTFNPSHVFSSPYVVKATKEKSNTDFGSTGLVVPIIFWSIVTNYMV